MNNYFNSLSKKDKLSQLSKCRFMKSDEFSDGINMLIDKKNVFIANKNYDITNNLIELIDNQIKNIEIK